MKVFRLLRYFLYCLVALAGVTIILPVFLHLHALNPGHPILSLETDWIVERDETVREGVNRKDVIDRTIGTNDAVLLVHTLPLEEVPDANVLLQLKSCALRVYLEQELIDFYGDPQTGRAMPGGDYLIPLPEGYGGKTLSIMMIGTQKNAMSALDEVLVGNTYDLFRMRFRSQFYGIFYGIFFLLYGLMLFGVAMGLGKENLKKNMRILYASFVLVPGGLYQIAYTGVIGFTLQSLSLNTTLTYACLWLLPAAIWLVLTLPLSGIYQKVMRYMAMAHGAVAALLILLSFSGRAVLSLSARTPLFLALVIPEAICTIVMCTLHGIKNRPRIGILTVGSAAVMLGAFVDIVFFHALSVRSRGIAYGMSPFTIGLGVFTGTIMLRHYLTEAQHRTEMRRNVRLSGIAYTDPLTGCANRARCAQFMQELDREKASYCIINYDVNGLKKINDTLGHAEGDRFLKGFAYILRVFFKDADLVVRMGGDEYAVFLKNTELAKGADRADAFQVLLYRMNKGENAFRYEASYGLAHSSEVRSRKSDDVYRLADDRMYEMKRMVHLKNGGDGRD